MVTGWRPPKKISEYLTPGDVNLILSAIPKDRDKLFFRTLWQTGARVSEVNTLFVDNVDKKNNCILLRNLKQDKRKSDGKDEKGRSIFLTAKKEPRLKRIYLPSGSTLCEDILSYCKENNLTEMVFPGIRDKRKPLSPVYIWRLLSEKNKGVAWKLGIRRKKIDRMSSREENKAAWPHLLRHARAMWILKQTGRFDVVKEQLGHSSVMSTEEYAGLADEDRKNIVGGMSD